MGGPFNPVFAARSRAAECYTSMWDELRSLIYALE